MHISLITKHFDSFSNPLRILYVSNCIKHFISFGITSTAFISYCQLDQVVQSAVIGICVPYKILERLIYARVKPLIDPLLPKEQAGFRRGKSTEDQVVLLTQNIENSFEAKKKAGAVFVKPNLSIDLA